MSLTALHVPGRRRWHRASRCRSRTQTIWAKSFYEKNPANLLAPGEFDVPNVPAGDYMLSVWDFDQNNILYSQNVTVRPGEQTDMDTLRLAQWWTWIHGTVFDDTNANGTPGSRREGHPAPDADRARARRTSLYEHGSNLAITDADGHYDLRAVYPLGQWLALEQYSDGYKTTGLTWQAQHEKHADHQARRAVDVNFLPWIGQGATIDWGKKAYKPDENGGIVGVVSYGTTRNELDPDEAVIEDWQPGISGVTDAHLPRRPRRERRRRPQPGRLRAGRGPGRRRHRHADRRRPDRTPRRRGIARSTARASTPTAIASRTRSWPTSPLFTQGLPMSADSPTTVRGGHRRRHEDRQDRRAAPTRTGARR